MAPALSMISSILLILVASISADVKRNLSNDYSALTASITTAIHPFPTYESCDCGFFSYGCTYRNGKKICYCNDGYAQTNSTSKGLCKKCDCGNGECEFVFGIKKCTCETDFVEVNGKCQECDCGENSISCRRGLSVFRNKICTCKAGYAVTKLYDLGDESCKKCECGSNGVSCSFSKASLFREEQTCECKYGSYLKTERAGKKCKECGCGPKSVSCRFNSAGERRCECTEGFKSTKETGSYWGDEYCTSTAKEGKGGSVSGWRIGTYVLAVVVALTIIGLLIAIVNKNMNQRSALPQRR